MIRDLAVEATIRMPLPEWNWSEGVALFGLIKLWKSKGSDKARDYVEAWIKHHLEKGDAHETINATAPCFTLLELDAERPDPAFAKIVRSRVDFLLNRAIRLHNGALEHTLAEVKFGGQMWVDTLFMAGLFLAKAGLRLNWPEALEEGVRQHLLHMRQLQQKNGLLYHGWDEKRGGPIGCLWARGNAWASIVSVELLEMLPTDHPARSEIADRLRRQLSGLYDYQDPSGLWTTVIDAPQTYLETSAAAGFAYALKKGMRLRIMDDTFVCMEERASRAVLGYVDWEGVLRGVSAGTAVQNHAGEYHVIARDRMTGYGQGLLLMLLSE